jgi:FxsC-like protein
MAYDFFFSYKRVSNHTYQRKFFEDLSAEVRDRRELPEGSPPVGFFDQEGIDPGDEWGPTLSKALQESKVLVCALSPAYFRSEYCGKEWQVFLMRRGQHQRLRQEQGAQDAELPPVIKPIIWLPLTEEPPAEARKFQLYRGTKEDVINSEGLYQVLKLQADYETEYKRYISRLARDIIEAAGHDLPPLPGLPALADVPSAFAAPQAQPAPQPGLPPQPNPQPADVAAGGSVSVKFIFVAGDPSKFGGQRQPDAYLQRGGQDWKPFHPTPPERIMRIITRFVAEAEVDYDIEVTPFGADLINVVQQAYDERQIVVLIVDGWTLTWDDGARDILRDFDARNRNRPFYNCSVLVPWNEADLELKDRREDILKMVRETFYSRTKLFLNPFFYRDSIGSVDKMLEALRDALTYIRAELHQQAQERKPVPAGISKPVVSNQTPPAGGGL